MSEAQIILWMFGSAIIFAFVLMAKVSEGKEIGCAIIIFPIVAFAVFGTINMLLTMLFRWNYIHYLVKGTGYF